MGHLKLWLLGRLEAQIDGVLVRFPTRHSALLLARLALAENASVSREHLAALFWGERNDEQARGSLRQTIYRLRQALGEAGEILDTEGQELRLRPIHSGATL